MTTLAGKVACCGCATAVCVTTCAPTVVGEEVCVGAGEAARLGGLEAVGGTDTAWGWGAWVGAVSWIMLPGGEWKKKFKNIQKIK